MPSIAMIITRVTNAAVKNLLMKATSLNKGSCKLKIKSSKMFYHCWWIETFLLKTSGIQIK
jgi:hypothetical protein